VTNASSQPSTYRTTTTMHDYDCDDVMHDGSASVLRYEAVFTPQKGTGFVRHVSHRF
jgi:hypothetical protein